ncbi:MAG: sialidase family protein [Bacteroidota bacterium]
MIRFKIWIGLVAFAINGFACTKKSSPVVVPAEVAITSSAPANPVLQGLPTNPQLRIGISIPVGNAEINYRKIKCRINPEALNAIQKLDVFMPNTQSFAATNSIASIIPSGTDFEIPVDLHLGPGNYYIWISVVIKSDADINASVELHCTEMVDAVNKSVSITELANSVYKKQVGCAIRKGGDNGIDTYRIPGLITTDKGTLIAVYDARYNSSADLPANIDVGLSRSTDGGKTWETMKIIMDMGPPQDQNGVGDPSVLFDPVTQKIWVAALWSKGNHSISGSGPGLSPDQTGQLVLVSSSDDGLSWSAPFSITPQVKDPTWNILFQGPGRGIAMEDGKIVFPAQYWTAANTPYSSLVYSSDHGASWQRGGTGAKSNTTESQLVETTPGTLMLNMRDNRGSFRSVATTTNMGSSWTEHATSYNTLPDPVCMGSLIKAKVNVNGTLKDVLFFSNPNSATGRYNITIKASLDLGQTWLPANQLLIDERQCYGYSCLTKVDDNTIAILYEGTKDLYFVKIPVSTIIK